MARGEGSGAAPCKVGVVNVIVQLTPNGLGYTALNFLNATWKYRLKGLPTRGRFVFSLKLSGLLRD